MLFRRLGPALVVLIGSVGVIDAPIAAAKDQAPNLNSLADADLTALSIVLERSACFGTCPAYTVTIYGDGRVEYSGQLNVKEKGTRQGRVEATEIRALLSEFARAKFLSTSAEYSEESCTCSRCTDMPTATIEISVRSLTYRVKHYHGCSCAPRSLFGLESAIDKAANSGLWTGDVTKQGPYGYTCFGPKWKRFLHL